jgi:hypothetical protein
MLHMRRVKAGGIDRDAYFPRALHDALRAPVPIDTSHRLSTAELLIDESLSPPYRINWIDPPRIAIAQLNM